MRQTRDDGQGNGKEGHQPINQWPHQPTVTLGVKMLKQTDQARQHLSIKSTSPFQACVSLPASTKPQRRRGGVRSKAQGPFSNMPRPGLQVQPAAPAQGALGHNHKDRSPTCPGRGCKCNPRRRRRGR